MSAFDKINAIRAHLESDDSYPDVVSIEEGRDNTFVVNQRQEPVGTSPRVIKEHVALVRKALVVVLGEEKAAAVRSTSFADGSTAAKILRVAQSDAMKKLHDAQGGLWALRFDREPKLVERGGRLSMGTSLPGKPTLIKRAGKKETSDPNVLVLTPSVCKLFENTPPSRQPVPNLCAKQFDDMRSGPIKKYEKAQQWANEVQEQLNELMTYDTLRAKFMNNEKTQAMMKVGIHDLLNTLYFIADDEAATTLDLLSYRGKLRAAFDGLDFEDDRASAEVEDMEWLVLDDAEKLEALMTSIGDSLWAFNSSFLASFSGIDAKVFSALSEQCEGGNDAIKLVMRWEDEVVREAFINKAVNADGAGHFLSHYDGKEIESGGYFMYLLNQRG